ncbi:hypothetical protein BDV93DRAFT_522816 [Ceratobasidium sp. AG-I]|nr:hypothetical protein BDV93DRAFT_522816 [Ceratobasidium sp. AG-I]
MSNTECGVTRSNNAYAVERIAALYLVLQPLTPPVIVQAVEDPTSQDLLVQQILRNPHVISYPPALDYQRRAWKSIIAALEEKETEVHELIYSHFISIINTPIRQGPPEPSYLTYLLRRPRTCSVPAQAWRRVARTDNFDRDCHPITILESRTTIERGTTGLKTWRASLDLSEWILANSDLVVAARILELGSGTGLLGLLVATLQQLSQSSKSAEPTKEGPCIYMTDVDEDVLSRCTANLRRPCNGLGSATAQVRTLDWTDSTNPNRQELVRTLLDEADANVILAADVVYDPSIIPPLTRTLRLALQRPGNERVAYVALTLRREETFAEFTTSVEQEGLAIKFIDMVLPPPHERVFCGGDNSFAEPNGGPAGSTKLMRLSVRSSESP